MSSSVFRADLFAGQVAFVTGGGTGICRGITEALASHGATTVIFSRKPEHVEAAAEEISRMYGQRCLATVGDVRVPEQVDQAVAKAVAEFGRIDILINGAAGNFLCPAEGLSSNAFGTVLDIDTKGTWNVSRAVYHAWMKEHGGRILNISATLHYGGTPLQLHVAAAKAGVDALTKNLAVEWGPKGIRVNAIAPGPIADTEGAKRLLPGEIGERLKAGIPIRRLGKIEDIANLSLFVLSEGASNLNGAILVSDGGQSLCGNFIDPASLMPGA